MSLITAVMATRNSATYVADALNSIVVQGADLDVLVVDASSTDGTVDIAQSFSRVQVMQQTGTGLWQAWNQAIEACDTPLIAMLDSDDLWESDSVAAHLRSLGDNPAALASIGRTRFFLQGDRIPPGVRPDLLTGTHRGRVPGATMYRREVFDHIGLFPLDFPTSSDVEWFLRLRQTGLPVTEPDDVVLAKRVHPDNLGGEFARADQYDQDLVRIARESLQRRRMADRLAMANKGAP